MRKRKQRKLKWGIVYAIAIFLLTNVPVLADETSPGRVDGSKLTDDTESISEQMFDFRIEPLGDTVVTPLATYLYGGTAKITNAGDGKVNVYANTKASTTCDKVELDIYLQYCNSNGNWVHVNNWNYSVKNKAYLTASRTLSVTKGRYYRIKCYHAITKNGVKESSVTATNGIPIK